MLSRTLLRLDIGGANYLGPLFGFVGDQTPEFGGRAANSNATYIGEPRHHLGIGEACVDLFVDLVDDLVWRCLWRGRAEPRAHLVALDKLPDGRKVRQRLRALRAGDRKTAQLPRFNVLDR